MRKNTDVKRCASLAIVAASALAVWLLGKLALRWFLPFVAAFIIARAIEPAVRLLTDRLKIKRAAASGICAALVFAAILSLTALAVGRAVYELSALAKNIPRFLAGVPGLIEEIETRTRGIVGAAPPGTRDYISYALEEASERGARAIGALPGSIISGLSGILSGGPGFLLFVLTGAVGTFFISSGYAELSSFVSRQIPERRAAQLRELKAELRRTLSAWLRAQLILSGITFSELAVLFCALRIDFALLLALAVAAIDMLPAFGAGMALVPWGLIELLRGDAPRGIALLASFGVIAAARNVLEPKLVGRRLGLPPLAGRAPL
ncbi:MAG: sporulation integral membrane protein YtvI [Oscillospiraceae bacterium]|nr:sporulation integral membrane protein YtvI [Oscillospiraceae bacterium]